MTSPVATHDELRAIAIGAVASVLLYASGFLVIFTPLPTLYLFLKKGRRAGLIASAVALVLVALVYTLVLPMMGAANIEGGSNVLFALPGVGLVDHFSVGRAQLFGIAYFLFYMAVAYALGLGARQTWSIARWVGGAVVAGAGSIIVLCLFAEIVAGVSVIAGIRGYVETAVAEIVKIQGAAGMTSLQARYVSEHQADIASLMISLLPSLIFVFTLLTVVLNVLVARRIIGAPHAFTRLRESKTFRMPDGFVWFVIAGGAIFFADHYMLHVGWLKTIGLNGLIAFGAVYFFQGLAVTAFYLGRVRMKLVRVLAYVAIIIFFQSMGLVLMGVGLADVWFRFRERPKAIINKGN